MRLLKMKLYLGIIISILVVVLIIVILSVVSFGVEAESVIAGYNSTRTYARQAKLLEVSMDNYKDVIDTAASDADRRENAEYTPYADLGEFGNLKTPEVYEAHTVDLVISSDKNMYESWGQRIPDTDRSMAANYSEDCNARVTPLNYLTSTNAACGKVEAVEMNFYASWQCCLFGNWYVNQVSYKDYVKDYDSRVVYDDFTINQPDLLKEMGTCWVSDSYGTTFYNNPAAAVKFLEGVTPGTLVRTHLENWHSYIVLGADSGGIVLYDGNMDGQCGVNLTYYTWEQYCANPWLSKDIHGIIAPPNTKLPQGCYDELNNTGYILS